MYKDTIQQLGLLGLLTLFVFFAMFAVQSHIDLHNRTANLEKTEIYNNQDDPQKFGAVNLVGGIPYYLYGSGVGTTDTSITLTSFEQPVNEYPLAMTDFGTIGYLTIEPGNTSRQEFVSFTGVTQNSDGTATLTGVTRGLAFVSPYTASTTLRAAHAGGSVAVLSNPPQVYNLFTNKNNEEVITGEWHFDAVGFTTAATSSDECNANTEYCTKTYIDALGVQGAGTSTEANLGVVELATLSETAAGTASSSAGGPLVARNSTFRETWAALTHVPVTTAAGKISQSLIDLTQHFIFSSIFATNASSTNATTTNQHITGVTSSVLVTDANGLVGAATNLSDTTYGGRQYVLISSTDVDPGAGAYATSSDTLPIPSGTITASSTIRVGGSGTCIRDGGTCDLLLRLSTGETLLTITDASDANSVTFNSTYEGLVASNNSTSAQKGITHAISLPAAMDNGGIVNGESSSSIDLSGAFTLVVVSQGTSSDNPALANHYIIVDP